MQQEGWEATGIEISKEMCEYARSAYGIRCLNRGVDEVGVDSLGQSSFDVVTMWGSFAHLFDPRLTLTLCHQVLKPGGKLVILTSNSDSLEETFLKTLDPNPIDLPRHLYHFNRTTMAKYFAVSDFHLLDIRYFTLNTADRLAVILKTAVAKMPESNALLKILRALLLDIALCAGISLSVLMRVVRRPHTIIVIGEKTEVSDPEGAIPASLES